MNDITAGELILAIIISIIFCLAIYGPIKALRNRNNIEEMKLEEMKLEAISRGYAEWVINPTNGVSTWQWK